MKSRKLGIHGTRGARGPRLRCEPVELEAGVAVVRQQGAPGGVAAAASVALFSGAAAVRPVRRLLLHPGSKQSDRYSLEIRLKQAHVMTPELVAGLMLMLILVWMLGFCRCALAGMKRKQHTEFIIATGRAFIFVGGKGQGRGPGEADLKNACLCCTMEAVD